MAINPSNTRPDSEHNYTGTNFAVTALIVLLVLVGGYFLVSSISDVADDPANVPVASPLEETAPADAAGAY